MRDGHSASGHAFLCYVREDAAEVDGLQRVLQAAGISTWRDTGLWPGEDWRARIRQAITREALAFIVCFSSRGTVRQRSYQNEELTLAIDQLRLRLADKPWLLPVRFDDCDLPDMDLGAGRTLASLQRVDLFGDRREEGIARLVAQVLRILGPDLSATAGADVEAVRRPDLTSVLRTEFSEDLDQRRRSATSLLLVGVSMTRTVQAGSLTWLRQIVVSGGKVRVLVVDPTEDVLVRAAGNRRPQGTVEWVRQRIRTALDELINLRDSTGGNIEVRVARLVPAMGVHAIDVSRPDGLIILQHYEYRPAGEPSPIVALKPSDGVWYEHFAAEAERLWEDGIPWPLSPADALRQSARPFFTQDFGPELEQAMSSARELLITGVARNTLLTSKYHLFEDWLTKGCSIRMLLMDPSCEAIAAAADRYYADRSQETTRDRIRQALRLLAELRGSTGGDLLARLTTHPLAIGTIAVDASPRHRSACTALFAEYYTYQAKGEPKFVLQPGDGHWFNNLYLEAEKLWNSARDVDLESLT